MNKQTIIITILSVIGIVAFFAAAYAFTNKPEKTIFEQAREIQANDNVKWSAAKKHVLVEYSDLQCPACRAFHNEFKKWEADPAFKPVMENVTFVYRHFPLVAIHRNARSASVAAEAAGKQGKFFEYVDVLFEKQDEWGKEANPQAKYLEYAKTLNLNTDQFQKDMADEAINKKVSDQEISGTAFEVEGTPTFYLNGKKLNLNELGGIEEFKKLLIQTAQS